jgi:hypothetical protein
MPIPRSSNAGEQKHMKSIQIMLSQVTVMLPDVKKHVVSLLEQKYF